MVLERSQPGTAGRRRVHQNSSVQASAATREGWARKHHQQLPPVPLIRYRTRYFQQQLWSEKERRQLPRPEVSRDLLVHDAQR
jgi:hypothetical protein